MNCGKCIKEKDKLWWFNSDHSVCDGYFYCKECFKKLFKILPEKVKLTFYGYKRKETNDVQAER